MRSLRCQVHAVRPWVGGQSAGVQRVEERRPARDPYGRVPTTTGSSRSRTRSRHPGRRARASPRCRCARRCARPDRTSIRERVLEPERRTRRSSITLSSPRTWQRPNSSTTRRGARSSPAIGTSRGEHRVETIETLGVRVEVRGGNDRVPERVGHAVCGIVAIGRIAERRRPERLLGSNDRRTCRGRELHDEISGARVERRRQRHAQLDTERAASRRESAARSRVRSRGGALHR